MSVPQVVPEHVDPVERGLRLDLLGLALVRERAIADLRVEVLGDLVLVDHAAGRCPILPASACLSDPRGPSTTCRNLVHVCAPVAWRRGVQLLQE
jgi:hypothetical protein